MKITISGDLYITLIDESAYVVFSNIYFLSLILRAAKEGN